MSLRNKISFFLILISLVAVFATGLLILQNAITDKKNYVTELSSVLGPQITYSLDQKIKNLVISLNELNSKISQSKKLSQFEITEAVKNFKIRNENVDFVFIKTTENKLISFSLTDDILNEETLSKLSESLAGLNNAHLLKGKLSHHQDKIYLTAFNNQSFGAVALGEQFFKESFELARSKPAVLISGKKTILYKSNIKNDAEFILQKTPVEVWLRSELISLELQDDNKQIHLVNFSKNSWLDKSYVVLVAPQASWQDLTAPILKSSFGLILLLVIFSIIIAYSISDSLARPIEELSTATSQIGRGDWKKIEIPRSGTEIRKLSRAFNRMIENLKNRELDLQFAQNKIVQAESLAAVGRMGAGIAHEVKNPLSSILGYGQLIEMKISNNKDPNATEQLLEKIKEYVRLLLDDTRRANKIISELLTFTRQKAINTEKLNLINLLNSYEPKLKTICEIESVNLVIDISQAVDKYVNVDAEQIYQVIFNLFQNAIHALRDESVKTKSIRFKVIQTNAYIEIIITDNGPGIAEENIKKIFEPFFSTKKVGEGTGLGLAICYGIILQHQGTIEVASEIGAQTSFIIRLPLVD